MAPWASLAIFTQVTKVWWKSNDVIGRYPRLYSSAAQKTCASPNRNVCVFTVDLYGILYLDKHRIFRKTLFPTLYTWNFDRGRVSTWLGHVWNKKSEKRPVIRKNRGVKTILVNTFISTPPTQFIYGDIPNFFCYTNTHFHEEYDGLSIFTLTLHFHLDKKNISKIAH